MVAQRRMPEVPQPKRRPATTPEAREQQLISLAVDLVEKRMREGSATSQEVTHFLKLGSSRERLEQEKLGQENHFLKAKREALESQARVEAMYSEALNAMRSYAGFDQTDESYE